jgi:hypothetical protein
MPEFILTVETLDQTKSAKTNIRHESVEDPVFIAYLVQRLIATQSKDLKVVEIVPVKT